MKKKLVGKKKKKKSNKNVQNIVFFSKNSKQSYFSKTKNGRKKIKIFKISKKNIKKKNDMLNHKL